MLWPWLALAGGYLGLSYVKAVGVDPVRVLREARAYCDRVGKPLLDVGCGTRRSSVRVRLFGYPDIADVACDPSAPRRQCAPRVPCYCDAYSLPWPDRHFGAVVCSHVLANLPDPLAAAEELLRVADRVYVVLPKGWAPLSWYSLATPRLCACRGLRRSLRHPRIFLR